VTPDQFWLGRAVELSRLCPISGTAFAVGAVIIGPDGRELATGYSRETDPHDHAEETALRKLRGTDLTGATIYSSLEPCSRRASHPRTCAELILEAGIPRVVYALREPPVFVEGDGAALLTACGVQVDHLEDLADEVRRINAHVLSLH
jgi:pyrimidine deaminase RibD-like protein